MVKDIIIINYRDILPKDYTNVNVTSQSTDQFKWLSPFYLKNIFLYNGIISKRLENAWQYSKVYPCHVDKTNFPTAKYWEWAHQGWNNDWAVRYPMGKGAKPLYSYWNGKKLDYIQARKKIYIPLYRKAVEYKKVFEALKVLHQFKHIALLDFDGYNHKALGMTYNDVLNCTERKMGHAFVLGMMLEGHI